MSTLKRLVLKDCNDTKNYFIVYYKMSYSEFVKKHYEMVRDLPAKERFAAIAKMYHEQKSGKAVKGGMEVAGSLSMPKKHSKAHSKAKGGILVGGSEVPFHGLVSTGVPKKHGKAHGGMLVGGGLAGHAFGDIYRLAESL
jgi:hypothetical protein